jgi:hypothetical protein
VSPPWTTPRHRPGGQTEGVPVDESAISARARNSGQSSSWPGLRCGGRPSKTRTARRRVRFGTQNRQEPRNGRARRARKDSKSGIHSYSTSVPGGASRGAEGLPSRASTGLEAPPTGGQLSDPRVNGSTIANPERNADGRSPLRSANLRNRRQRKWSGPHTSLERVQTGT